ncbi:hypothetical protein Mrose_02979 [Calidithermus roseus]|uniref:Uncharacterized protein n=1 Tax=Calidithermus roseus TaxID=1644118 RepID=A0A399EN93_9DEIN|nr:hypothetical protein Mrose_02979 [Calidithermus roseus]
MIKAESAYKENTPAEFAELIKAVAGGASPAQMDRLRGLNPGWGSGNGVQGLVGCQQGQLEGQGVRALGQAFVGLVECGHGRDQALLGGAELRPRAQPQPGIEPRPQGLHQALGQGAGGEALGVEALGALEGLPNAPGVQRLGHGE